MTTRIADFASVMNIDVPEAAEKFRSGLSGETEPLRKFGIDVSAAAVNVKALELGLGDVTGKLSEGDKILARYQLIMEQTEKTAGDFANTSEDFANKQRILNAKIEDAKAEIGDGLLPVMADLFDLVEDLIPLVVDFGEAVGGLVGDLSFWAGTTTRAEKTMRDFQTVFGQAPKSITDVKIALKDLNIAGTLAGSIFSALGQDWAAAKITDEEFEVAVLELFHSMELTKEEAGHLRDNTDDLVDSLGLGAAKSDILRQALDLLARSGFALTKEQLALADAIDKGEDRLDEYGKAIPPVTEAEKDQKEATDEARKALERKQEALEDIHNPLTRIVELNADLAEAEDAVNAAEDEFGVNSDEYRDAVLARAGILGDLQETLRRLREEGIDPTGEAARSMLAGLGIPQHVIDGIFADFDAIEANLAGRRFIVEASVLFGDTETGVPTPGDPFPIIPGAFHRGGRVNAPQGQEVLVRALGGEEILGPDEVHEQTVPVPVAAGGQTTTITNYYAGTQIGNERILRELAEKARRR